MVAVMAAVGVVVAEVTVFAVVVIAMITAVAVVAVVEITVFAVVVVAAVVVVDVHPAGDIDPEEPINMLRFLAFEFTQETPQSV